MNAVITGIADMIGMHVTNYIYAQKICPIGPNRQGATPCLADAKSIKLGNIVNAHEALQ